MAGLPAAVRCGLLWAVRLLVVRAHRAHRVGVGWCGVAVRAGAGVVDHLGGRLPDAAQSVVGEIEGFHVRAGLPQGPQRRHVDRVPATGFRLLVHQLLDQGRSRVENHTVSHPDLTGLDAAGQKAELCGARDQHLAQFGDGPRLVRPPYGVYDATTRTTARACGAKAVVTWTYDLTTWGQWTPPTPTLKAGDIILLHFNETLEDDLRRALDLADAAGLKPAPLREYVPE
ncbi:polysaccharide deacetylase family protein [Streptomyces sp. NPDC048659]|uniref:polysaccharide deacetylase family protein n=1 Tax=Streptomyces sp. NPDC048659 TaxID=3155489 RepID=UPI00341CEB77